MDNTVKVCIYTTGPGVYCLGFYGGTGKTYLYNVLKAKSTLNKDILCITYDKDLTESDVIKKIQEFNGQVLMLDRLNMYYTGRIGKALSESECITFIDLKDNLKLREMPIGLVRIKVYKDSIEVRQI